MWKCEPKHLKPLMSEGERFPHLIDRLIRASAARFGVKQCEIQTQLRTNITDGGVDTAVDAPIKDSETGWFDAPTCWQFKAQSANAIDDERIVLDAPKDGNNKRGRPRTTTQNGLQLEINKPHVRTLIQKGYAYRLCILGDLTDTKVKDWETQLAEEANKINPNALAPRVVHGGFLPNWIEKYPAVFPWLVGEDVGAVFHMESWGNNITKDLPKYVANHEWKASCEAIRAHCDFANKVASPCLRIGGAAGIGKSRLVYEVLRENDASAGLVVYAADEQEAMKMCASLANNDYSAWLVADECSEAVMNYLNQHLKGAMDRVRAICINNVKPIHNSGQIWLQPAPNVSDVLVENYGNRVPKGSCQKYAHISKGFLRFASDMCEHHAQIESGNFGNLMASVETYIRDRFGKWLNPASLLALFRIVGFEGDVVEELNGIADISGIDARQLHQMVHELKDSPGFVVKAGRFRYISPEIVARTIYQEGWHRYVSHDLSGFVAKLPSSLIQPFLDRAAELGGEEVRAQVAKTFQVWAAELTIEELRNAKVASILRSLIETKVDDYLPLLRALLSRATAEEIKSIGENYQSVDSPRRILVWMLESLVAFPDYFDECEECLFALARGENEEQIGNNATEIWADLFSVVLSGSAATFNIRLRKLQSRIEKQEHIDLCLIGLGKALMGPSTKTIGPPTYAGRIRPDSWRPETDSEWRECLSKAISTLSLLMSIDDSHVRASTLELIREVDHHLIDIGLFDELSASVSLDLLNDFQRRALHKSYEEYLTSALERGEGNRDTLDKIRSVVEELQPSDFVGRFRTLVSRDPWDERHSNSDDLAGIAKEILSDPCLIAAQFEWLKSEEAQSAEPLGFRLAVEDTDGSLGLTIAENAMSTENSELLRGYIRGWTKTKREFSQSFVRKIDQLQEQNPLVAADAIRNAGDRIGALQRILKMVAASEISPHFLASFAYGYGDRDLIESEIVQVLETILEREKSNSDGSISAATKFVNGLIYSVKKHDRNFLNSSRAIELCWAVAELGSQNTQRRDVHEIDKIVDWLRNRDQVRAFNLFSSWLTSDKYDLSKKGAERLMQSAREFPDLTMLAFGNALLDEANGFRLQLSVLKEVVRGLPSPVVLQWVEEHGARGAATIARHLPLPYRNQDGAVEVPEVTRSILESFPTDDIMGAFSISSLSGSWWGSAEQRFREEAAIAKELMSHESESIRKWAKAEFRYKIDMAEREQRECDEQDLI